MLSKSVILMIFLVILLLFILRKNRIQENYAPLDIYYPSTNTKSTLEDKIKDSKLKLIEKNEEEEGIFDNYCLSVYEDYLTNNDFSYLLLNKNNENEYSLLHATIYDINNSDVYLEPINDISLMNHTNYGLKIKCPEIYENIDGFSLEMIPYNNRFTRFINGFIQGNNNGEVNLNPIEGNKNSIFNLENCSTIYGNEETLDIPYKLLNRNLIDIIKCNIVCNNQLYLHKGDFENTLNNHKKCTLKKHIGNNSGTWYLMIYDYKNIDRLYRKIITGNSTKSNYTRELIKAKINQDRLLKKLKRKSRRKRWYENRRARRIRRARRLNRKK